MDNQQLVALIAAILLSSRGLGGLALSEEEVSQAVKAAREITKKVYGK